MNTPRGVFSYGENGASDSFFLKNNFRERRSTMNEGMLEGKVAIITGAGSGIGRAAALLFSREGGTLMLADIDPRVLDATLKKVLSAGGIAEAWAGDLTQDHTVRGMVDRTMERFGRLDCAFNNAGSEGIIAATADCEEENWDRMIACNLKSIWLCLKYELKCMVRRKRGSIVNTGSVAGLVAERGFPAYAAAKSGVIQLSRSAAVEYAPSGIRINAVCPGLIQTPMSERAAARLRVEAMMPGVVPSQRLASAVNSVIRFGPIKKASLRMMQPMGRPGKPKEVAEAALWLCSDRSSFVTGHALLVDGGLTAQ
jgi:NAD(P)-dependent dehydrogenase (short-subunit alcohol dehydrogenase family)